MRAYPEKTEVIYTLKRLGAYFLSAIFFNVLGTAAILLFSGKWNWYPALLFASITLITILTSAVISLFQKQVRKIYLMFAICHFISFLLPFVYFLAVGFLSINRFWGTAGFILFFGLILFLIPRMLKEHAMNFMNAFSENCAAGVYNPKTNRWKVSVPIIRKSREQDGKTNLFSKVMTPLMYAFGVSLNRLLGKYNVILIIFLLSFMALMAMKECLFYLNLYSQIKGLEKQTGKEISL